MVGALTIKQVSSANDLVAQSVLLGRSFIQIKNRSGPNVDPCGTPTLMFLSMRGFMGGGGQGAWTPRNFQNFYLLANVIIGIKI